MSGTLRGDGSTFLFLSTALDCYKALTSSWMVQGCYDSRETRSYVIRTLTLCALYGTGRQNSSPFGQILNHLYRACTVAHFRKVLFQYCHTVDVSCFPHDQGLLRSSEAIWLCRAALFGGPENASCTSYLVPNIYSYVGHSVLLVQYDAYFGPEMYFFH